VGDGAVAPSAAEEVLGGGPPVAVIPSSPQALKAKVTLSNMPTVAAELSRIGVV
jgi:hypothetical protein